jgi:formyltetrahydrofolate synthetase
MVANEGFAITSIKNAQNYTCNTELQNKIRRVAKEKYGASDVWVPDYV